jgi:hypothetical protein
MAAKNEKKMVINTLSSSLKTKYINASPSSATNQLNSDSRKYFKIEKVLISP